MDILDLIRALTQQHSRIRVVLTGSVGLHHVLAALRDKGYRGSPINHMQPVAPGPLSDAGARLIARELIRGQDLPCADPQASAQALAAAVGNVAFYIHRIVSAWPARLAVVPEAIDAILNKQIIDPNYGWHLDHYRTRIPLYYGEEQEKLILFVLDALAAAPSPLSLDDLCRELNSRTETADKERVRTLLKLLIEDHYLDHSTQTKTYAFRYPLIRRWWRLDRDL